MAACEEVAEAFGRNLLRVRRRVGFSQEELAVLASVHRSEVGLLEHGRRLPRIDTVIKLGGALGIDPEVLLDGITWHVAERRPGGFDVGGAQRRIEEAGR